MSQKPETLCTGCGATITQGQDGNILDLPDFRDVTGSLYCLTTNGLLRWPYARHFIEFPPVAIKPEAALTPLENDMLSALKESVADFWGPWPEQDRERFRTKFPYHRILKAEAAIAKAEPAAGESIIEQERRTR